MKKKEKEWKLKPHLIKTSGLGNNSWVNGFLQWIKYEVGIPQREDFNTSKCVLLTWAK